MVVITKQETRARFSRRLNELLDERGAPVRGRSQWLSRMFNGEFTHQAARQWLEGQFIPDETNLAMLCTAFGWSGDYLRHGHGPKYSITDKEVIELLNDYGASSDEDKRVIRTTARNASDLRQFRRQPDTKPEPPHPRKRSS